MIDADALIAYIDAQKGRLFFGCTTGEAFKILVDEQPTIEPERKKGRWKPFDFPWFQCSECGAVRSNQSFMENYCPNCGADMRGEQNESDYGSDY